MRNIESERGCKAYAAIRGEEPDQCDGHLYKVRRGDVTREVRGFSTGADGLRSYYRVCGGPRSQGGRRGAVGDKSRPRFTRQRLRSRDNPYDTLGPISPNLLERLSDKSNRSYL